MNMNLISILNCFIGIENFQLLPAHNKLHSKHILALFAFQILYKCTVQCMSMSEVGAQGDPCMMTIFLSIVRPHLLYSTSSRVAVSKYSVLHSRLSS
jgi:hypothetical protein